MVNEMYHYKVKLIREAKQRFYDVQHDLLNSKFHNFANHFDVFIDFCEKDGIMKVVTTPLKNDDSVDIQKWWDDIFKTGSSRKFELPSDPNKQASIFYQFFLGIKEGKYDLLNFCLQVYGETKYDNMIYDFNDDITNKLVRFLNRKINEIEDAARV